MIATPKEGVIHVGVTRYVYEVGGVPAALPHIRAANGQKRLSGDRLHKRAPFLRLCLAYHYTTRCGIGKALLQISFVQECKNVVEFLLVLTKVYIIS